MGRLDETAAARCDNSIFHLSLFGGVTSQVDKAEEKLHVCNGACLPPSVDSEVMPNVVRD